MRNGQTTIFKRIALPFALILALALPVGAGAAVKLDSDDAAVRIPTAIFGTQSATGSSSRSYVDGHDDKDKDKDKKCKEKKEDCDDQGDPTVASEPAEPQPPADEKPPTDEEPNASWSG